MLFADSFTDFVADEENLSLVGEVTKAVVTGDMTNLSPVALRLAKLIARDTERVRAAADKKKKGWKNRQTKHRNGEPVTEETEDGEPVTQCHALSRNVTQENVTEELSRNVTQCHALSRVVTQNEVTEKMSRPTDLLTDRLTNRLTDIHTEATNVANAHTRGTTEASVKISKSDIASPQADLIKLAMAICQTNEDNDRAAFCYEIEKTGKYNFRQTLASFASELEQGEEVRNRVAALRMRLRAWYETPIAEPPKQLPE